MLFINNQKIFIKFHNIFLLALIIFFIAIALPEKTYVISSSKFKIITKKHNFQSISKNKRQESLCPKEYQNFCWCDYINTNSNNNNNHNNEVYFDINKYDAKIYSTESSSVISSSIMIDCQFLKVSELKKNNSNESLIKNNESKITPSQLLDSIPKIKTAVSSNNYLNKFKYLNQITYLDLSRTGIKEIPTDAFNGLNGLKTIVITNCEKLKIIKMFAFRNLPNLKSLIISNNPMLIDIEAHALGGLKNLNYLSLTMNKLSVIDGYIFSSSSSIKVIDFIGNPIKKIKSHAFHGLRNVTDLLLSLKQNIAPIEIIEGDSFISTVFVDQIFLEGIPAKILYRNAFRGLSFCKNLYLNNSHLQEIEKNAFHRSNNINIISFLNSKIKRINSNAFNGAFNINLIDLRGNYLSMLNKSSFGEIVMPNFKYINELNQNKLNFKDNESIILLENINPSQTFVKKILLEQNPIQCDCSLEWVLNKTIYSSDTVTLPEICAGPRGYDCFRISDLSNDKLPCLDELTKNPMLRGPCEDIVFDVNKDLDIYSISVPKGKSRLVTKKEDREAEKLNYNDYYDIKNSNSNYFQYENTSFELDFSKTLTTSMNYISKYSDLKASKSLNLHENLIKKYQYFTTKSIKLKELTSQRTKSVNVNFSTANSYKNDKGNKKHELLVYGNNNNQNIFKNNKNRNFNSKNISLNYHNGSNKNGNIFNNLIHLFMLIIYHLRFY